MTFDAGCSADFEGAIAGTAGFSNEALPAASALLDGEKGVILQHWLPGYRTNIGFTEIDGRSSEITATAFNEVGVLQGQTTFRHRSLRPTRSCPRSRCSRRCFRE